MVSRDHTDAPVAMLATRIPRRLHRRLVVHCVAQDRRIQEIVREALEEKLARERETAGGR